MTSEVNADVKKAVYIENSVIPVIIHNTANIRASVPLGALSPYLEMSSKKASIMVLPTSGKQADLYLLKCTYLAAENYRYGIIDIVF